MEKDKTFLGTEPVGKLIVRMSLPAVVGVLAYNLYNAADTVFIAKGVGTDAAGGLAVSFPLFLFLSAVTSTLGAGGASVISRALGQKDERRAARTVGNSFALFYAVAILVTVFGLIFLEPLLYAMGVTDTLLPYAKTYTRIILLGAVTCTGFSNLIRAEGSSRYAMYIWVIPVSLNLVLDPILIFGCHMGIAGAALGTVAAQCVSMGMSVYYFFLSPKRLYRVRLCDFRPDMGLLREVIGIGVPSFLQVAGYSLSILLVNQLLGQQGSDLAISTFGIVNKIQAFLILGITGMVQGVSPIIGYNFGAKNLARVRETMRKSYGILIIYGSAMCLLLLALAEPVMRIFSSDPQVIHLGGRLVKIMGLGLVCSGIQSVQAACFQAVGKKGMALFLSLCNYIVCFLPLMFLFYVCFGTDGIWYAFPASNFLAMLISCACMKKAFL